MPLFKKQKKILPALCLVLAFLLFCLSGCGTDEAVNVPSSSKSEESHVSGGAGRSAAPSQGSIASTVSAESEKAVSEADEKPPALRASLGIGASLFAEPLPENAVLYLEAGTVVFLSETTDPLWYSTVTENGASGYLYAENLYRVEEDGSISSESLFRETAERKFAELQELLPDGKYWNHMWQDLPYGAETPFLISDTPCEHSVYGELYCNFYNGKTEELFYNDTLCQCLGFASLLSDQLFGRDAPLHVFYDIDSLRIGDHIRLHEYEHSMTVLEKSEDFITVAEVNEDYEDCLISWTRQISYYELEDLAWDSEYISRYPLCPDGEGGFISWEE